MRATKTNLKSRLTTLGVSFCILISLSVSVSAMTWYDSEGRPLSMVDGKLVRGEASEDKTVEKNQSPIIPKALEIRPELSTVKKSRTYRYAPYHYAYPRTGGFSGYSGYYGRNTYRHGCYRPSGVRTSRKNLYLNYRRDGYSIRAKF